MSTSSRSPGREPAVGRPFLEAPFVGRAAELEALTAALDASLRDGKPGFVLVDGAAGVGKSRLVREFLAAAQSRAPAAAILQGRCLASGRGSSYWALGEVLRRACGFGLDDRAEEAEARLRDGLARILAPLALTKAEFEETLNALATSAGVVIPANPFERGEPRFVPLAINGAWTRLLRSYTRRGGAILVIEDLHWAGSALISALPAIAAKLDGPFLLVSTARPAFLGREPDFMSDQGLRTVEVSALGADDAVGLVDSLVSSGALPDDVRRTVVARAEGNPYFLEETVRHIAEGGSAAIPGSIQAVLVARIEALPLAERRVLQEAAVVGRIFWEGPVRLSLGATDIADPLRRLADRGLVFTRPSSSLSDEVELSFKHALLRDAAYGTMTTAHRARSHASVGQWLEGIADDPKADLAGLIGEHYRLAMEGDGSAWSDPADRNRVRSRAIRYLMVAGSSAHQRYSIDRAIELHEAALRLATSDAERARALAALGQDHESGLDGVGAVDAYRRAIEAADRALLPANERAQMRLAAARTMALRWGAFPVRPKPAEMDAFVDEGLALAEDPETRLWLLLMRGGAGVRWGAERLSDPVFVAERTEAVNAALDGARQLGLTDLRVVAGRVSAQLGFAAGRYDECAAAYRDLAPLIDSVESVFQRALTAMYVTLGLSDVAGAYAEARVVARKTLEVGRTLSPHEHAHGTAMTLWCLYHLGEWSDTAALVDEHVAAVRGTDVFICPYMRGGAMIGALMAAHLGDFERAHELINEVQLTADEPGWPEALHARVLVALGDAESGAAAAQRIIDSGRLASLEENEHESVALLEGLQALGEWDRLRAFLPDARRRSKSLAILDPVCDRAEGVLASADGEADHAIELLQRAVAGFERLGVPYEIARTKMLLATELPDGDTMLAEATAAAESLLGRSLEAAPAGVPTTPRAADASGLSGRELEILALIGEGISNQEIADRLVLSPRTVERHVSNIYVKLGLEGRSSRAAAASYAVRSGLDAGPPKP